MILVQRTSGEYCEIFQQEYDALTIEAKPAYIQTVGSQTVLGTHDRVTGSGGYWLEEYWTFDKDGPIPLDLRIIDETVSKLMLPEDRSDRGYQFEIQTLSAHAGEIFVQFALVDHQLVVTCKTRNANTSGEPKEGPRCAEHTSRIKVDGIVQAQHLVSQVLPVFPELLRQITGVPRTIELDAVIGKDGEISQLSPLPSDFPLLIAPAMDAVRRWHYSPTMVDGYPVEVETTIAITIRKGIPRKP